MNVSKIEKIENVKNFIFNTFKNAILIDEHATLLNFEIPRSSIDKLSIAFKIFEKNKKKLFIQDYSFSQSTLEQVFLKKIKPTNTDFQNTENDEDNNNNNNFNINNNNFDKTTMHFLSTTNNNNNKKANFNDYLIGYCFWLLALLIPGLHHYLFGNNWRALKYFVTYNEVFAGFLFLFYFFSK
jgi:hypothetical protein